MVLSELKEVSLPAGFGETRGSEHEVWFSRQSGRVIKATHGGEFGRKFGPERFATSSEYLDRIDLTCEVFSLDWMVEGYFGTGSQVRIVTSQPIFVGTPATPTEIASFLGERGFRIFRTRYGDAWYRHDDNVLVSDAEPNNCVAVLMGLAPIDFLIMRPSLELLKIAGISGAHTR